MMEHRRIGSLDVSLIGLGCNNFGGRIDQAATTAVVNTAIDCGITFFDTADIYGGTQSEVFLGKALGARRRDIVLATKFGMAVDPQRKGAHPDYVRQAMHDSLRRLGTDYVDLYQLHTPDPTVPIVDTLGALDDLVREGKVREIGCSNVSADQLREAGAGGGPRAARFVSVQNEYSLLHREPEREVQGECGRLGVALIPYFPLASGMLTGKYRKGRPAPQGSRLATGRYAGTLTDPAIDTVEGLMAYARSQAHSLLELAISWLASRPAVASVIAGATRPEQVKANVNAASWKLTRTDLDEVDAIAPLA